LDRAALSRAQTPQTFRLGPIRAAHRAAAGAEMTDDVAVAQAAGLSVALTPGDEANVKLTTQADFVAAAARLEGTDPMEYRSGSGFDVHAFGEGDAVVLCGVRTPHARGLQGHSDADVGMHALTDAIFGALAEGDIGRWFPPSDPQWKGAASHIFLDKAVERVAARGGRLVNADVTLICERPKIGPLAEAMRARLAEILKVEVDRVSVKATTTERLGFAGREEGIAAMASVSLALPEGGA
ncbi:MAG: 2-C-methyl-D-erythritol 2,4-cyclodiphosphate synthase, partial [Pseudomonadota bacterium]